MPEHESLKKKWAWALYEDAEGWEGPCDSREQAVAECESALVDHEAETGERHLGVVSPCTVVRAEEWITSNGILDIDRILEEMEDNLAGEWPVFDGSVFSIKKELLPSAQEDLLLVLKVWAQKYVDTRDCFMVDGKIELVRSEEKEDDAFPDG